MNLHELRFLMLGTRCGRQLKEMAMRSDVDDVRCIGWTVWTDQSLRRQHVSLEVQSDPVKPGLLPP